VAAVIAALLVIVVLSYRQTCYAYPNGGGRSRSVWTTSAERGAGSPAAALLVDYVNHRRGVRGGRVVGITSAGTGNSTARGGDVRRLPSFCCW